MFEKVEEEESIYKYLLQRNLLKQYLKSKEYLLLWNLQQIDFRIRKPKQNKIYYFKVNDKYRAYCYIEWMVLRVFKIDDHQK